MLLLKTLKNKKVKYTLFVLLIGVLYFLGYHYPKVMDAEKAELKKVLIQDCGYLTEEVINKVMIAQIMEIKAFHEKCKVIDFKKQ
jgi:hypothetical protein